MIALHPGYLISFHALNLGNITSNTNDSANTKSENSHYLRALCVNCKFRPSSEPGASLKSHDISFSCKNFLTPSLPGSQWAVISVLLVWKIPDHFISSANKFDF